MFAVLLLACLHPAPPEPVAPAPPAPVEPAAPPPPPIQAPALLAAKERPPLTDTSGDAPWLPEGALWKEFREAAVAQQAHIYGRLVELCDEAGHRLAGSPGQAISERIVADWIRADGLALTLHPVKVPVWVRGTEQLQLLGARPEPVGVLTLGGSVATPAKGIEAKVVVIREFAELGPHVKDHIVLFNHPMEDELPTIDHYGPAVGFRTRGATEAAKFGAKAVLVRSVTTRSLYTPHTGGVFYGEGARIPAASIPTEEADRLSRLAAKREVRVKLTLTPTTKPDADAANVIGELRGSTWPEEVIVIGGHLDSWDVGQGAHDDGAGVVSTLEALNLVARRGTPKRTVRFVAFANEENGLRGGREYFATYGKERHVAAIESDLGGGRPMGFSVAGTPEQVAWVQAMLTGSSLYLRTGGAGADISPLTDAGVLGLGMHPDDRHYFDVHHTWADTVDKVDPRALAEATGALAALVWELANADGAPPQGPGRVEPD